MKKSLVYSLIALVVAVLVVGGMMFWVDSRPVSQQNIPQPQPSTALSDQDYQQQVSALLSDLATAPEESRLQRLDSVLSSLQALKVSSQVKYDHLMLFTALDVWRTADLSADKKNSIKTKLQTFAGHQPWSKASIDSLIIKGGFTS